MRKATIFLLAGIVGFALGNPVRGETVKFQIKGAY